MPFDEEDDSEQEQLAKILPKHASTQKSMFEGVSKKSQQEALNKKAQEINERGASYKTRMAELVMQFNKMMADKTLKENKNIFSQEMERESLSKLIQLASEINADVVEQEGMGSLSLITVLLKMCLAQRDRSNNLEYNISLLQKKMEPAAMSHAISQEVKRLLDKQKGEG